MATMKAGQQQTQNADNASADTDAQQGADPKANQNSGDAALRRMSGVGGLAKDTGESLEHGNLKDAAIDIGGGAVGLAEKAIPFFKYSVKPYEAQVSEQLYRGSRVDPNGMANLKKQGITGIVNLCAENDMDSATAAQLGMNAKHIPLIDNTAPSMTDVQTFLSFVSGNGGPVYVHCEAGQGRTGTMCASYRMAVQGWSADQAVAEAKKFGMKMPCQIHFLEAYGASLGLGPAAAPAKQQDAAPQGPPPGGSPNNS